MPDYWKLKKPVVSITNKYKEYYMNIKQHVCADCRADGQRKTWNPN